MTVEFINPGDLDRRITIVRPIRTRGAKGQEIVERRIMRTRWANVEVDSSDEDTEDKNVLSVAWLEVTMYRFCDLKTSDELEYEGRRYNIMSINEVRLTPFVKIRAREVLSHE